jgi:sec-independent protein translocase protein TatC
VSPGLYRRERRYALPFIFFATILFVLGGLFGYYIALPVGLKFLIDFGKNLGMSSLINVSSAFDLVFALELGMGIVFEIPAVIFLLSRLGIVSGPFLLRNVKYAVLGCFIAAAIITPTGDIGNMMILAVPMLGTLRAWDCRGFCVRQEAADRLVATGLIRRSISGKLI